MQIEYRELIEKWRNRNVNLTVLPTSYDDKIDMRAIISIGDNVYFMTSEDCYTPEEINSKVVYLLRERKLKRICE